MDMQSIHDNLPEHAKAAISGVKNGTTYIREGVNSKIGEKRTFKTSQGMREMIELGPVGASANIIKVRCCATGIEFIMKRLEMVSTAPSSTTGNPGLVSVEAMEALACRADLIPSLPENPNLVHCYCSQADNSGLVPAKVLLLELCGESLADALVQAGGSMKADQVLHVLRDVAGGLFCLHSMEKGPVVHGSLEPAHILHDTKSDMWKLGSFGAAHLDTDDDAEDTASDIWQLGILLLTLLFGATKFDKKSHITTTNSNEVRNTIVASISSGCPTNNVEGRILLLATWLLAADPCKRPSAEQVVIACSSLGVMPAPQLALAFPDNARKDFKALCMGLVRRTIFEAVSAIDGSDRCNLVNKYGEEALRNPASLPNSVKEKALSTQQSNYIRIIQSFLPVGAESSMGPDAKILQECLERIGSTAKTPQATTASEPTAAQAPVDLLDFEQPASKNKETTAPPKAQDTMDLMGFEEPTAGSEEIPQLIPAPQNDLLCSMEPLPVATPEPSPQLGGLDLFDAPSAPPQQPKSSDLDGLGDLFSMPAVPQQAPAPAMPMPMQSGVQQQVPAPVTPMAVPSGGYAGMHSAGMPMAGAMPSTQSPTQQGNPFCAPASQSQGPIVGMTQIKPPKKEEPKDPFAGLAGF